MKICIVPNFYVPPVIGGAEIMVANAVEALANFGSLTPRHSGLLGLPHLLQPLGEHQPRDPNYETSGPRL